MSSIATLAVQLTANTAPFTKKMQGATNSITNLQRSAAGMNNVLAGVMGRFSGIMSVSALATGALYKFNQAFERVEETGDMAAILGASVANMNALRMATAATGNDMAKMTNAIAKMSKALGDSGSEKAFQQIGLDPAKLRQMDSIAAFEQIAQQINKLPTAFDRAKAMADLFGKGWIDMAEVVGNVDAIDAARSKLQSMGLDITEIDTRMVDAANTAKREFFATLDAGFDKSASASAKYKKNFFDNLNAIASTIPRMRELMGDAAKFLNPLGYMANRSLVNMAGLNANKGIDQAAKSTDDLTKATNGLAEAQKRQQSIADSFGKAMDKIKDEAERAKKLLDSIATPGEKYGERVNEAFDLLMRKRITMDQYDRYLKMSRDELFNDKDKDKDKNKLDMSLQTFGQTTRMGVMNYLRNVARGTQINGSRISGPGAARVQEVRDPQLQQLIAWTKQVAKNTEDNTAVAA